MGHGPFRSVRTADSGGRCGPLMSARRWDGKVAVSWQIVGLGLGLAATILNHETATLPVVWDWCNASAYWRISAYRRLTMHRPARGVGGGTQFPSALFFVIN